MNCPVLVFLSSRSRFRGSVSPNLVPACLSEAVSPAKHPRKRVKTKAVALFAKDEPENEHEAEGCLNLVKSECVSEPEATPTRSQRRRGDVKSERL